MAQRLQKRDGTFSYEAKQSTDFITRFRFIVLGSDDVLIKEVCDTILRETDRTDSTKHGTCECREACVSGRHVSVVKTPAYWLEPLKTYLSFSRRVRSMRREMEFCYSLAFPGPHAFLLVLGDVRNSGKEHYILRALSEVFGQEALDYSMVLFMHEYRDSDIGSNRCVRKCRKRFHILKNNEDNVLKLFHDATGPMIKQRRANFFTKDLDLLDKAETYFRREFDAKYEERESRLRDNLAEMKTAEENLRTKMTEMEKQNSENVRELQDLREELDAHKARENQLRKELDASISREIQLSQQMDALKKKKYELMEELYALRYYKRQLNAQVTTSSQIQLERNRLQEEKEVQVPAQEEHDRPNTSDRREVEQDERERKLPQTVTGSRHCHHISVAVAPPSDMYKVQDDLYRQDMREEHKEKIQNATGGSKYERLGTMESTSPALSDKNKDRPLDEKAGEINSRKEDSQASELHNSVDFKCVRLRSMEQPHNTFEGQNGKKDSQASGSQSDSVRRNSKEHDLPDKSVLPPKKFEKWWIRSNGSTSIPEILKEFPRPLEKLGMMLKGRVPSKSCPLCFPNQYSRTEERSSDPQPQNPGSHSFDVQPVGTNMVMHSCTLCALVMRQRHPTPSPLFRAMPLEQTCCLRLFIKSFFVLDVSYTNIFLPGNF